MRLDHFAKFTRLVLALSLASTLTLSIHAEDNQDKKPDAKAESKPDAPKPENKLPADATISQSIQVDGHTLKYNVTVGTITLKDTDGKPTGEVVYTAYTVPGNGTEPNIARPVTFALNGGPGASSVYLNFGAIGPKRLTFGNPGDSPSDPATLNDNPGTWLDFTDLVFIDPIGTGFSRSLVPTDQAKKLFYAPTPDVQYLSLVIYDWLVKNSRLTSRKYLVGESYGGFRGPRITHYLQSQLGVALNGVTLVSPYLNPAIDEMGDLSPLPWMLTLPSITAANLERQHKLTPEAMADVIAYTRGQYATDLLAGHSNPESNDRLIQKVTELTGLDSTFVRYAGGRLDIGAYLREVHRSEGKIGSVYDSNVSSFDPFPFSPTQQSNDPLLESIIAPTTTAMVDFVTRIVGWKTDNRYYALSYEVNSAWDNSGNDLRSGSVNDLRQAVAADPKLRVSVVHGWNDLSCPFMGSVLTVDQMPIMGDTNRVQVHEYPGGHMFYTRPDSSQQLKKDIQDMYAKH